MSRPPSSSLSGRSTPQAGNNNSTKLNRNLSAIRKAQINGVPNRSDDNVLASLRATQLLGSKPVLPAELIATILDYLPIPELMRCARISHQLQEMVYDDTRWVQKLRAMGVWNEAEARQRVEDVMKRKAEAQKTKETEESRRTGVNLPGSVNGIAGGGSVGRRHAGSVTLFDAGVEEQRFKSLDQAHNLAAAQRRRNTLADGFDELTITPAGPNGTAARVLDTGAALTVMSRVRSVRGYARQEFGKIYAALGPLYNDLARSRGHSDPLIFRTYHDPEQQAQVLSQLKRFAQCDNTQGWHERESKLDSLVGVFENAVLREFEQGNAAGDVDGRMKRYAHVLVTLNGGAAAIDVFISNQPVMTRTNRMGSPLDCLESVAPGHVDLSPSQSFFEKLAILMVEQAGIIDRVFPPTADVLTPFLLRLSEEVIAEYLTTLFDESHSRGSETYAKGVSGTFEQAMRFVASLTTTQASPPDFAEKVRYAVTQCYEKHIDLYLAEELAVFRAKSEAEVGYWEKELSEQQANTESFFMSNINRQAAKRDFLSSFKKVVMMPVNVLPAFPFAQTKVVPANKATTDLATVETGYSRSKTPGLNGSPGSNRTSTPVQEAPTSELAAKAAIMNSRLEGIKSLFSIEVALNLTHFAKTSLERAAVMVKMGGKSGEAAKEQCGAMFVELLHTLGDRHIRTGFDKAVEHLSSYNPREVREYRSQFQANSGLVADSEKNIGVEPLVTFLELVNVGDLIQQMLDVFYVQELVSTKLTDRDDFLNPAVKEKKRFEQMLDERVAAGLNKGIDVLMDEVEYICASTQLTTDFNPGGAATSSTTSSSGVFDMDIGPSTTANQVIAMVSSHTGMLVGSTDKNMLDVFMQEVGLRLFGVLCKHIKRQRISVDGAIKLISDINSYSAFVGTLRQKALIPYFTALRELGQIYLVHIDPPANYFAAGAGGKRASFLTSKGSKTASQAKELAAIIADSQRYCGIFPAEEVYEFAERRADWYLVRNDVERAMYGVGCVLM